jgi:hypothetical protein
MLISLLVRPVSVSGLGLGRDLRAKYLPHSWAEQNSITLSRHRRPIQTESRMYGLLDGPRLPPSQLPDRAFRGLDRYHHGYQIRSAEFPCRIGLLQKIERLMIQ